MRSVATATAAAAVAERANPKTFCDEWDISRTPASLVWLWCGVVNGCCYQYVCCVVLDGLAGVCEWQRVLARGSFWLNVIPKVRSANETSTPAGGLRLASAEVDEEDKLLLHVYIYEMVHMRMMMIGCVWVMLIQSDVLTTLGMRECQQTNKTAALRCRVVATGAVNNKRPGRSLVASVRSARMSV